MKATDSSGLVFHVCDFCGASNKGEVSIFVSPIDRNVAICKSCVNAMPLAVGKFTAVMPPYDRLTQQQVAHAAAAAANRARNRPI